MTASAAVYRPPFISQRRKDQPPFEDCVLESSLMLLGAWTLGEGLVRPDGDQRDLYQLSETLRKRIQKPAGGLTLADADEALHTIDPDLPPLPRYPGQTPAPAATATLRLTFEEFRQLIIDGHAAIILGYQTDTSTVGHAIHVSRGNPDGPIVMDPWERKPLGWQGERWTWKRLREFTERKVRGDRFGSPSAIACAVVPIGAETQAERAKRDVAKDIARLTRQRDDAREQTKLASDERDAARTEARLAQETATELRTALTDAAKRIAELEARPPADCTAIALERDGALERAALEADRAIAAETRVREAVAVLTR